MIQISINGQVNSTVSNWQFFKDVSLALLGILMMGVRTTRTYVGRGEEWKITFSKTALCHQNAPTLP